MSASYKPTLLAAIVRNVDAEQNSQSIGLTSLADEYLKMYWSQVVVFRMRHSPRDEAQPKIVQHILECSATNDIRRLADLSEAKRGQLIRAIAKVLTINVLKAFHASKPDRMPPLYSWSVQKNEIELTADAVAFIRENALSLKLIAFYFLALFLSKLNTVPHILEKVERDDARRESLTRFAKQFQALGERTCFYCNGILNAGAGTVDHFIPWSFVFEDRLWNLVPACRPCNSSKSDRLPDELMLQRLLMLNKLREAQLPVKKQSRLRTLSAEPELQHLFKLARDEGWPKWRTPPEGIS
jgi:5-methylcytosine-specific restriction endonuclease McrA